MRIGGYMNKTAEARALTLMAAFLWGTSFVAIKWGLQYLSPAVFVAYRFLVASGILILLYPLFKRTFSFSMRILLNKRLIMFLGFTNAVAYFLQFIGMQWTTAAKASILVNTTAIFVAIISHFVLDEKLTLVRSAGVLAAFVGVIILVSNGDLSILLSGRIIGDVLCILAGFVWSIYMVASKSVLKDSNVDATAVSFLMLIYTAIFLTPIFMFEHTVPDLRGWIAILYTAAACTVAPFFLWYLSLKVIRVSSSAVYLLMEVVVAAVLAQVLLGEYLSLPVIFGGVLIVLGSWLVEKQ